MKKIMMILVVVAVLAVGCSKGQKSNIADGTWTVVSINCPYLLAEKDGKTETFSYFHPSGKNHLLAYRTQACIENVKPGWIVQVEDGRYAFFPPKVVTKSLASKSADKPAKKSKITKIHESACPPSAAK